jgi:hypothetical protein
MPTVNEPKTLFVKVKYYVSHSVLHPYHNRLTYIRLVDTIPALYMSGEEVIAVDAQDAEISKQIIIYIYTRYFLRLMYYTEMMTFHFLYRTSVNCYDCAYID